MKKILFCILIISISVFSTLGAISIRPYSIVNSSYTYELSPWESVTYRGHEYTQGIYFDYYNHNVSSIYPRVLYNIDNRFRDVVCTVAMNTNDNKSCDTSFVKLSWWEIDKDCEPKKGRSSQDSNSSTGL